MTRLPLLLALLLPPLATAADPPKPTVVAKDLKSPQAVCVTPDGRTFVAVESGIVEIKDGKATAFADLKAVTAVVPFQQWLYTAADGGVHRVPLAGGKAEVWAAADDFPKKPTQVTGMTADERGTLYLIDGGGEKEKWAIHSVAAKPGPKGATRGEIKTALSPISIGSGHPMTPVRAAVGNGLTHLFAIGKAGEINEVRIFDGQVAPYASTEVNGRLLCADPHGRLFAVSGGRVWAVPRRGEYAVKMAEVPDTVSGMAFDPSARRLLLTDPKAGTLLALPAAIPGWEVDETPLSVELVPAFDTVKWTGWDDGSGSGKVNPFRPIVITHAGDGSGRTFVATQHGVIHTVEKGAKASKVFLDLQSKVLYKDTENEQGLLGLAFHPKFKTNGEFYLFYTDKAKKLENVLSRFKVKKDDPTQADPASEEELLRVSHRFWNHDGGTVAFGPDGYLYLVLGDGGDANDPDDNGQKLNTLLGKILRLDVDNKGEKTAYAIPKDNPYAEKDGPPKEIFAHGVRNPWRLSFDRKTGQGWFGDVGQNLFEEINLLKKGANYGWRRREGLHPFNAGDNQPLYTDPIWEYHHDLGKSITAGHVYRGKAVPALDGHFLYADYVSGKVWGLKYDEKAKRVTANRPVAAKAGAWMSFGEDEAGEAYLMTYSEKGKGIFTFKAK